LDIHSFSIEDGLPRRADWDKVTTIII